jgi:hypothetical protein
MSGRLGAGAIIADQFPSAATASIPMAPKNHQPNIGAHTHTP